jgi:hypothetical protein
MFKLTVRIQLTNSSKPKTEKMRVKWHKAGFVDLNLIHEETDVKRNRRKFGTDYTSPACETYSPADTGRDNYSSIFTLCTQTLSLTLKYGWHLNGSIICPSTSEMKNALFSRSAVWQSCQLYNLTSVSQTRADAPQSARSQKFPDDRYIFIISDFMGLTALHALVPCYFNTHAFAIVCCRNEQSAVGVQQHLTSHHIV